MGMFEVWANPLRDGTPQPRSGHDFNQAKSGILNKLKAILSGHLSFAVDSCCLHIATDDNKDTYYSRNYILSVINENTFIFEFSKFYIPITIY